MIKGAQISFGKGRGGITLTREIMQFEIRPFRSYTLRSPSPRAEESEGEKPSAGFGAEPHRAEGA